MLAQFVPKFCLMGGQAIDACHRQHVTLVPTGPAAQMKLAKLALTSAYITRNACRPQPSARNYLILIWHTNLGYAAQAHPTAALRQASASRPPRNALKTTRAIL
jgi:hypothetical protein